MSYKVYIVEDDRNLNLILTSYLKKENWEVYSFLNGRDAEKEISNPPDLWILDIMLPDIDGYQLIKKIKSTTPDIPVIFISARDEDIDRLLGLELGGDDYLPKPFLPKELVIRSRNILERTSNNTSNTIEIEPYTIDKGSRIVNINNKNIDLTSKEYDLLLYFAENIGLAMSRNQILDKIWGEDYFGSDRVVDDLVRRLRKKMPELDIGTVYGYGYRMEK